MSWFKRIKEGITTSTREKKETPEGLWHKCKSCKKMITTRELTEHLYVCPYCDYHTRIGSEEYFQILFDEGRFTEINAGMIAGDPLGFSDTKLYTTRLSESKEKNRAERQHPHRLGNA